MTTRLLKSSENINGLPIGFQEVEYLASDGNQWIDTGYTMTDGKSSTFEGTMMWTASQGNANFFYGYRSVNSAEYLGDMRAFFVYGASPAGRLAIRYGVDTENSTSVAVTLNKIFNISFDGTDLKVDGTTYVTHTQSYTPANYRSMWLFNCNCTGYYSADVNHFIGRIYRWKMFQDGTPVRDFIPALNPAGRPCMYDLVGKKAYYNLGTGEFSYGRKIIPVEYLESTGTQYIDTGIKLTNNHSVELDYQLTQASQLRAGLFGALNMSGSNQGRFGSILSPSNAYLEHGYGASNDYWQQGLPDTNRHKIYQKKNEIYFDGTLVHTFSSATFSLAVNAYLGNFVYTNYTPAKAKYYSSRWWEGDTLIRDYIPCIDENNVGYMFDKVTHTIYDNAGTGTFNYGKKLYSSKVRLYKDSGVKFGDVLPKGLKRVEYLENTGTGSARNWISTGIVPDTTTRWEVRVAFNNTPNEKLMGCGYTNPNRFNLGIESSRFRFAFNRWFDANPDIITPDTNIHTWVMDAPSKTFTIDGYSTTTTQTFGTSTFPIALFGRCNSENGNTETSNAVVGKIYYSKIWQNDVLVSDMVPVLDNDSIPCMYDKVSGELFYNKGTGEFTYGDVIPNKVRLPQSTEIRFPKGYTEVEYLESDSIAYIDTGVSGANNDLKIEMGFSYSKFIAYGYLFSNYESEQHNTTRFLLNSSNNSRALAYINTKSQDGAIYNSNCTKDNFHTFVLTKTSVSIDGNTTTNNNPPVGTANTKNIILFNRGAGTYYEKRDIGMRCYYFRIYDNDNLIRYFIPALDPNGKPCMWDVVTKQPFYNQGTGEFTYGRTIQQVEYLESSGTQYIDTLWSPLSNNLRVKFKAKSMGSPLGTAICGAEKNGITPRWVFILYGQSGNSIKTYPLTGDWNNTDSDTAFTFTSGTTLEIDWTTSSTETTIVDKVTNTSFTRTFASTMNYPNNTVTLKLFQNSDTQKSSIQMNYYQIWDNGTLVANYVPAIDSNNVGFMFDRVTHTIFDNAGTGTFSYGSQVPNKIRD